MGHDFRPAYLKISNLKRIFPKFPSCFNQTATPRAKRRHHQRARFKRTATFEKSFARKNIAY
jgi:ATP-dependent DNA helicase RecQ